MNVRVRVEPPNALPFEKVLEAAEIVIGRATNSGLVVSDTSVSRQHARLFERDGQWWIEDLGATNGTWINGQPLKGEASVQAGDQLRVGETLLLIDHPRRSDSGSGQRRPISTGTTKTGQISLGENVESDRQAARLLEHELVLAHQIQMAMLPRRFPEHADIELAASLVPARSVGGDLYDFVLDDDRLWFMVGDVSGKGVPAALVMAVAKTLFRATAIGDATPATVLGRMNRELSRDNERMVFVTALVGHLRLSSGELTLGDAGHHPAMLVRDRRLETIAVPKGIALGIVEDATYEEGTLRLKRGDALVLYTDGATDARNRDGELFGAARLEQAVGAAPFASVEGVLAAVAKAVDNFAAGAPPEDDLVLLALRYRGQA